MKCPSCANPITAPEPRCPHCRLSLQRLDMKFGLVPAHSRFLTDRTGKLPLEQMTQLRAALRLFQKKFPQSLFSIFITELPRGSSATEYAFWMANRAKFNSGEKTQGENFNLLFVIDLASQTAALTVGYGMERYLAEQDLKSVLDDFASALRDDDLSAGLRAAIDYMTRRLRELSQNAPAPNLQTVPA